MTKDNYHQDDHLPFETEPECLSIHKEEKEVYRQRLAEYLKDPEFPQD
jgi:predicted metallo-beta-lactamase superfamily hydrolase